MGTTMAGHWRGLALGIVLWAHVLGCLAWPGSTEIYAGTRQLLGDAVFPSEHELAQARRSVLASSSQCATWSNDLLVQVVLNVVNGGGRAICEPPAYLTEVQTGTLQQQLSACPVLSPNPCPCLTLQIRALKSPEALAILAKMYAECAEPDIKFCPRVRLEGFFDGCGLLGAWQEVLDQVNILQVPPAPTAPLMTLEMFFKRWEAINVGFQESISVRKFGWGSRTVQAGSAFATSTFTIDRVSATSVTGQWVYDITIPIDILLPDGRTLVRTEPRVYATASAGTNSVTDVFGQRAAITLLEYVDPLWNPFGKPELQLFIGTDTVPLRVIVRSPITQCIDQDGSCNLQLTTARVDFQFVFSYLYFGDPVDLNEPVSVNYAVGGPGVYWQVPFFGNPYQDWANGVRPNVGDYLTFTFFEFSHNVWELPNAAAFAACNFSAPGAVQRAAQNQAPLKLLLTTPVGGVLAPFSLSYSERGFGGAPPAPMLAVGPDHAVSIISSSFSRSLYRVYIKSPWQQIKQSFLTQFHRSNTICRVGPFVGAPGAVYDHIADRWLLWEIARNGTTGAYTLCLLFSLSSIPHGLLYRGYAIALPNDPGGEIILVTAPDAYYFGTMENPPALYALDRVQFLSGGTLRPMARFFASTLSGYTLQGLMPAQIVGTPRDGTTCGFFVRPVDDETLGGIPAGDMDFVDLWQLCPSFDNPPAGGLFHLTRITVSEFDMDLCSRTADVPCFNQPGSPTPLTSYHRRLSRATMRNFDTYDSLLMTFGVDVGSDRAGVMWVELRRSTVGGPGPWFRQQDGVVRHSTRHAWLGSASIDRLGNIAIGYAGMDANELIYASMYVQGRTASVPSGLMSSSETLVATGVTTGPTTFGGRSWMAMDPMDGCTFYLAGPFMGTGSVAPTYIGATSFNGCRSSSACTTDANCNDGQFCTLDKCRDGQCVSVPNQLLCPFGTSCNEFIDRCM
eukprot:jgi/Mesvir1/15562/Mv03194-RA.1